MCRCRRIRQEKETVKHAACNVFSFASKYTMFCVVLCHVIPCLLSLGCISYTLVPYFFLAFCSPPHPLFFKKFPDQIQQQDLNGRYKRERKRIAKKKRKNCIYVLRYSGNIEASWRHYLFQ